VVKRWLRYARYRPEVTKVCSRWPKYALGKSDVTEVCPRCVACA
jgi:hypothetical protein